MTTSCEIWKTTFLDDHSAWHTDPQIQSPDTYGMIDPPLKENNQNLMVCPPPKKSNPTLTFSIVLGSSSSSIASQLALISNPVQQYVMIL